MNDDLRDRLLHIVLNEEKNGRKTEQEKSAGKILEIFCYQEIMLVQLIATHLSHKMTEKIATIIA